ncbi:hypothetical protein FA95DRAFT_869889 [Auriscalpium vulgare]|uniref:Uncharacterized protein n=1 Tax=Auriscalpium vulgare TaxID=40419 RepID=A0ACB8R8J7_9AGAM|nr:hypothetical protein FA95DRAFT_869889 [Auriscalpium vulgare]
MAVGGVARIGRTARSARRHGASSANVKYVSRITTRTPELAATSSPTPPSHTLAACLPVRSPLCILVVYPHTSLSASSSLLLHITVPLLFCHVLHHYILCLFSVRTSIDITEPYLRCTEPRSPLLPCARHPSLTFLNYLNISPTVDGRARRFHRVSLPRHAYSVGAVLI